jgi:hypothetical protein
MKRRSFLQALLGSVVAPWASVAMSRNTPGYTGTPIGDDIMDRIYTIPPVGVEVYESEFGVTVIEQAPSATEIEKLNAQLRERLDAMGAEFKQDVEAVYLHGGSHVPRVPGNRLYRDWHLDALGVRCDIPVAK